GVKIIQVEKKKTVKVQYTAADTSSKVLEVDKLIVSIGRVPNVVGLNPEGVGLKLDERGFVAVDADCRTNLPGVWAIGDVVRGPAEDIGMICHAHPSLSEAMKDAALAVDKRALNI